MENSNVRINNSRSCKYSDKNIKCCCSLSHENNNNIHIILENMHNKDMTYSILTQDKEITISVTAKNNVSNPIIENKVPVSVITQNENEYYCKYCQIGNCDKRKTEHLKLIHKKLTSDEKDVFSKVWHWRLAIDDNYDDVYRKAFGDLLENKFIENSKTRSKFSYIKDKGYGLISIVIDVIIKGKLLILNPHLIYILKDETTNDIHNASWCKYCTGVQNIRCPSYENINRYFAPSISYHDLGIQMCLAVTMTKNGLKIHSPSHITSETREVKKQCNSNFAKEYANEIPSKLTQPDYREFPHRESFPIEIIDIHQNITKPSIKKIYNDEIKGSS